MPKISDCDRCQFYAHSRYLICAVHPNGTDSYSCPDFVLDSEYRHRRFVNVLNLQQQTEELLKLLDFQPLLAGHLSIYHLSTSSSEN